MRARFGDDEARIGDGRGNFLPVANNACIRQQAIYVFIGIEGDAVWAKAVKRGFKARPLIADDFPAEACAKPRLGHLREIPIITDRFGIIDRRLVCGFVQNEITAAMMAGSEI